MFDSTKARVIAGFVAATATAAIPVFSFSPNVAGALAAVASFATMLVNFFGKKA